MLVTLMANSVLARFRNSDCGTESQSDNTVDSPHGFIIYGIEVFEGNEEVMKLIDVKNWWMDNSRVLRWVVSLIEWNSSVSSTKSSIQNMEDDVDISALTMEQYIALIPDDIKPGIVNPKIGDDIVDLFHFPGVTHDAIMLRVFPITLKGRALRWKNRLPAGTITTWDLLKKEFIWRYCHPFINAKKLEGIRNFKQERDETLYHAWERYNDLLYQCPLHDLNCQQKVHIFYTGLDISTRKILDSNGKRINDVMDNVDAIQKSFKGENLTKEYPLKKEDEAIKHSRYMESLEETIIKFCEDTIKK
ncbi:ribonuclease H-like domain-containing protein [Tanacetum coccineum]